VLFGDVMDALRALDRQASEHYRAPPHYRRVLANRIPGRFGRKSRRLFRLVQCVASLWTGGARDTRLGHDDDWKMYP
jgi:hypothetical protein